MQPHAVKLEMSHPRMLKAITCAKHCSDQLDAQKIADVVMG